MAVPAMMPSVN